MERAADDLPIEQVARRWIVGSDPEEVVEQVRPYVQAGFDHLVLHGPGHDQRRFLELYAEDLAGPLHALAADLPGHG
jgi:coenzyme F420-dependent glucose-6-phosphate dehydrogenase